MTLEIISIRVPKTGSSSFGGILNQVYPGQVLGDVPLTMHDPQCEWYTDRLTLKRRWGALVAPLLEGMRVVHTHSPLALWQGLYPAAKRICWLREPVACLISGYYFARALAHIPPEMDIWNYVELDYRRNWQSVFTGGDLSAFFFVGLQEYFAADLARLSDYLSWPPVTIPQANVSLDPAYHQARQALLRNAKFKKHVKKHHRQDCLLYQRALKRKRVYP